MLLLQTANARRQALVRAFPTEGVRLPLAQLHGQVPRLAGYAGKPVLVLAISSTCSWSDSVMPLWKEWFHSQAPHEAVALTTDSADALRAYLGAHGLEMPVVSTAGLPDTSVWRVASGRTPWMFLLDTDGTVLRSVHGKRMASIDSLASLTGASRVKGR